MAKILLDYMFPILVVEPIPAASTAFLKQAIVVAKPKSGQEGNVGEIYECINMTQVAARTDNTNAQQLFNAGLLKVFILLANDLDLVDAMAEYKNNAFTLLVSDDFDEDDIAGAKASGTVVITSYTNLVSGTDDVVTVNGQAFTAQTGAATPGAATFQAATSDEATATSLAAQINSHTATKEGVVATVVGDTVTVTAKERGTDGNAITLAYTDNDSNAGATVSGATLSGGTDDLLDVGTWDGVVGVSSTDKEFLEEQAAILNRCAFFKKSANGNKSMFFAFGSLLVRPFDWFNQQYIPMPVADDVETLAEAVDLFEKDISFVITDDEFSNRLALFAVGGKAIVAPYILKNLRVDIQSKALTWINDNQPQYTVKEAALLETRIQVDVIDDYIFNKKWITDGKIEISLEADNFVASGDINVAQPKALWRVVSEMRQTL